ncbi:MAG TPA: aldo/keto reductase [Iamia sp.]
MPTDETSPDASRSGTFLIGGDLPVRRLGFGAMRITGAGVWGPPADRDEAVAVVRRAVELGTTLIDTADSYGPEISEEIIGEALSPYPDDVVIATKAGWTRPAPGVWDPMGRPDHIRTACEGSLRRLRLDTIPLFQLHTPDPEVPIEESVGAIVDLQTEGKVRAIGLSNVGVDDLIRAQALTPIVTVQNRFNLVDRSSADVLAACQDEGIGFIPWAPLAVGDLDAARRALAGPTERLGASEGQVALAWLLAHSPVMLPIPGTGSVAHLDENVAAAGLELTADEQAALDAAV